VDEDSSAALADGIRRLLDTRFDADHIRAHAVRFGRDRFLTEIKGVIDETLAAPGDARW
jgi:hypothetical protein